MKTLISGIAVLTLATAGLAQPRPGPTVDWSEIENRISWFGTLASAKAAAERTGRPILLVSAAPHCHHVPGVW